MVIIISFILHGFHLFVIITSLLHVIDENIYYYYFHGFDYWHFLIAAILDADNITPLRLMADYASVIDSHHAISFLSLSLVIIGSSIIIVIG